MPAATHYTNEITDEMLEELEQLDRRARPAPWEIQDDDRHPHAQSRIVAGFFAWRAPTAEAMLVVRMRNALPAMLAEIRELHAFLRDKTRM